MIVRRLARPLLASVFVAAGIDALRHPGLRSQQAAQLLGKVPDQVPGPRSAAKDPDLFVRVNGAALLGGGVLLATGRLPRLASTVLAASIIPTTAIDHAFWDETDPERKAAVAQPLLQERRSARRPAARGRRHRGPTRPRVARPARRQGDPARGPSRQARGIARGPAARPSGQGRRELS